MGKKKEIKMSLPTPNLDDRKWQDIVEEAKKIIPAYCPQWTDFNPADPGITLVELMAWMTEMILYRLNRVPDKNYIKFMELMGIRLKTARPAAAWMEFRPAEGAGAEQMPVIPANTHVSGIDPQGKEVIFETVEPMNLNHSRLTAVIARINERYRDITRRVIPRPSSTAIDIFEESEVRDEIPHMLYISDPGLAKAGEDFYFCITTSQDMAISPLDTRWSYWDGREWRQVVPVYDETAGFSKSGVIKFPGLAGITETDIQGYTGYWLRVELTGYYGAPLPRFEYFNKYLEITRPAGIMPDTGFFSSKDLPFMPVYFEGHIMPFGREGQEGDTLYIGSDVFSVKGAPIQLQIELDDQYKPLPVQDLVELKIGWQYYSAVGDWLGLGVSAPTGTLQANWSFVDRTEAFSKTGAVNFRVPDDIAPLELAGQVKHWIRITVLQGHYGKEKKKNPPVIRHITVNYKDKPGRCRYYIANNDFVYKDYTDWYDTRDPRELLEPFEPVNRQAPELFLAFDQALTNRVHNIFFALEGEQHQGPQVKWEYYGPRGWKVIHLVEDQTGNLTGRGLVKFMAPPDWQPCSLFGQEYFWLGIRWQGEAGVYLPKLRGIHLNTVKAINAVSQKEVLLGSSDGQPYQRYKLQHTPVLPGPRIMVRELESAIPQEIADFKKGLDHETVEETEPGTGKVKALWVVWQDRMNFFHSRRGDRHYILDHEKGEVTFGDGIMGRIPPIGTQNIKSQVYYTGGGATGNLAPNAIGNLLDAIPFIDGAANPYPAVGGTDAESLEQAKLRAPWELKHRGRAVTAEDFEKFALDATGEVARAHVRADKDGIVNIMIIPQATPQDKGKPEASGELCSEVEKYIDRYRLITTRIRVNGPAYVEFAIRAEVVLLARLAHQAAQTRAAIEKALRDFFHPLTGGGRGYGWEMGRSVHISELYYIIEKITGVDYVSRVMLDEQAGRAKVEIGDYEFPYPARIEIVFVST